MRKSILWLLIAILAVSLAACGAPAAPAPAEEAAAEEAGEEAPAEETSEDAPAEDVDADLDIEAGVQAAIDGQVAANEICEVDLTGETIYLHQHAGREGPLAAILGDGFVVATSDAVSQINEGGGICGATLEVIFRETQYNVEQEVVAYEEARAYDPKPGIILTYGSGATIALKDRVVEDGIVNIVSGLNAEAIYNPPNGLTVTGFPIYSDQFAGFVQWVSESWADIKPEGAGDDIVVGVIGWASAYGAGATTPEALAYIEGLGVTVLPLEEQAISPDADVTGQIQNLMLQGANVIYAQNLSFGTAQVIGNIHALGAWDQLVVGGVNWTNNIDVLNILGENVALADGYYGLFPHAAWNDIDNPGIQQLRATFAAGGYPESDRSNTYLSTYVSFFSIADTMRQTVSMFGGLEGFTGENVIAAMAEQESLTPLGVMLPYDVNDGNRSGTMMQIRQATMVDGAIQYLPVSDVLTLPDTKPAVE
ncbi:MAG: ABC transporter substrate-binding protein [Chloroflexota bacterium]